MTAVRITKLAVSGFRNLDTVRLAPDPKANVLLGRNGQGKTSLLEAIDYTASLRSFRGASRAQLVGHGADEARVLLKVESAAFAHTYRVRLRVPREITLDGKRPEKAVEYFGGAACVVFQPGDLELVRGAPVARRRLLDRVLYGQLRYEGEYIPSVATLDSRYRNDNDGEYTGNVIYLSTFSKLLAPGLRLAWVIAPPEVIRRLVMTKQAADLHTSSFNQHVAYEVAKNGFLDEHVKVIRATYKERRDVMLEMMDEMFPPEVTWTKPLGGMFLWGVLPEHVNAADVLKVAIERKVAFVPGASFHPNGGGANTMRINFSFSHPDNIREGISRLGTCFRSN